MPNESPIYCKCSLPHTMAEARAVWDRIRSDWDDIRKNPAYLLAPDGSLRPLLCPPFPGPIASPGSLPSYEEMFHA